MVVIKDPVAGAGLADCIRPVYRTRAAERLREGVRPAGLLRINRLMKEAICTPRPSTCREAIKRFGGVPARRSVSDGGRGRVPWFSTDKLRSGGVLRRYASRCLPA
jgi:hypothetical protein